MLITTSDAEAWIDVEKNSFQVAIHLNQMQNQWRVGQTRRMHTDLDTSYKDRGPDGREEVLEV